MRGVLKRAALAAVNVFLQATVEALEGDDSEVATAIRDIREVLPHWRRKIADVDTETTLARREASEALAIATKTRDALNAWADEACRKADATQTKAPLAPDNWSPVFDLGTTRALVDATGREA